MSPILVQRAPQSAATAPSPSNASEVLSCRECFETRTTRSCARAAAVARTSAHAHARLCSDARARRGRGPAPQPAGSIHTFFMRFPIDVVFLDRERRVARVVPNRPSVADCSGRKARAVLELAAGEAARVGMTPGHASTGGERWASMTAAAARSPLQGFAAVALFIFAHGARAATVPVQPAQPRGARPLIVSRGPRRARRAASRPSSRNAPLRASRLCGSLPRSTRTTRTGRAGSRLLPVRPRSHST